MNMSEQSQPGSEASRVEAADMAALIKRIREFMDEKTGLLQAHENALSFGELESNFGFAEKGKGRPEVILSEDVFVELGHPSTASRSIVLITYDPDIIRHGRVSVAGPDLEDMPPQSRGPFAQVVMLAVDKNHVPDPFDLENTQYLMHRLPGYMVRSVPGRLWVRIGREQQAGGLNLHVIGSALADAYVRDFPGVIGVETLFVTSSDEDVQALDQVGAEARILSGQHKKLALGVDGSVECTELDCDTCDQKPVCDNLRDVVVKRRKQRKAGRSAK